MTPYRRIAVRAYSERRTKKKKGSREPSRPWPRGVLFFDAETRTDETQRLTFGSWRYGRRLSDGQLRIVEEGLFYADDLHRGELDVLADYALAHRADVDSAGDPELKLYSLEDFLRRVLYRAAYQAKAVIVGFNLPFDLSRLAWHWTRGSNGYETGFSLLLWSYRDEAGERRESGYRPRVNIKTLDSKRALMRLAGRLGAEEDGDGDRRPGPLLDLRTLAFALTDRSHSLGSACEAFGVEHAKDKAEEHGRVTPAYLTYNRRDVRATAGLYTKLLAEYEQLGIELSPDRVYSPATIGRAQLRKMGIKPMLERQPDFPKSVLGAGMVAYYGGRSECRVRRTPVPVVYVDFLSMYTTSCRLIDTWSFVTAEAITLADATAEVRNLLANVSVERCLDPETWKGFVGLVELVPDGEDILPVRAPYAEGSDSYQIGVNPLRSDDALWYTIPDAVASTILAGKPPVIRRAIRLVPRGQAPDLCSVALRGSVPVDPRGQDFFGVVVEERKRLKLCDDLGKLEAARLDRFLKVLASSTAYGIYAQMDRHELGGKRRETVTLHGLDADPFESRVGAPEEPGEFAFPPLAACITGAARLMLALLERLVADAGGTYAFCDTDSMAIVASEGGGLVPCAGGPHRCSDGREAIRALSFEEVERIRARFESLNPYDHNVVPGSVLELEKENFDEHGRRRQLYAYVVSAKRYALYALGPDGPEIIKHSEHGLGYLLNPLDPEDDDRDWIRRLWEWTVRHELGLPAEEPEWLDRPAIGRLTISKPATLNAFAAVNGDRPYGEQVKPYNFMLVAHTAPFGQPVGVEPTRFQPIAPWSPHPEEWLALPWVNKATGEPVRLTVEGSTGGSGFARVKTYREIAAGYRIHPEPKSLGPDWRACSRRTIGLLRRRPVIATRIVHVGKESNELEEMEAGTVHDGDELLLVYVSPRCDPWERLVRPTLREFGPRVVAACSGISLSAVKEQLTGRSRPHPRNERNLGQVAADLAAEKLLERGVEVPRDDLDCCATYLDR